MVTPEAANKYFGSLLAVGVRPPLSPGKDGVVTDAQGETILVVDPDRERADETVFATAALICLAVNWCAGVLGDEDTETLT